MNNVITDYLSLGLFSMFIESVQNSNTFICAYVIKQFMKELSLYACDSVEGGGGVFFCVLRTEPYLPVSYITL